MIIFLVCPNFTSSTYKRIIIKIGSDVVSDAKIEELARDCSHLVQQDKELLIVSSGAIKTGKESVSLEGEDDIHQKQAYAAIGQPYLMSRYNTAFSRHNQPIAQNLFTREDIGYKPEFEKRHYNTVATLERLLHNSVIPIINENDTTAVEEIQFGDNDTLSALVSRAMNTDLLIFLSDVDGVYTRESYYQKEKEIIPVVKQEEISEVRKHCVDEKAENGTGGMLSKINAAEIAVQHGCYVLIVNGNTPDIIQRVFRRDYTGTLFIPEK